MDQAAPLVGWQLPAPAFKEEAKEHAKWSMGRLSPPHNTQGFQTYLFDAEGVGAGVGDGAGVGVGDAGGGGGGNGAGALVP